MGEPGAVVGKVVQLEVLGGGGLVGPEEVDGAVGKLGKRGILINAALGRWRGTGSPVPGGSVEGSARIEYQIAG